MYRVSIIDIIRDVVESMTFPVTVNSVEVDAGTYVLSVCDLYHAQPGRTVTINDVVFTITAIDDEEKTISLTTEEEIEEDFFDDVTTFNLYTPFFFHGTPLATETELQQENTASNKTPMVWFLEQFKETIFEDVSLHERNSSFRLFFLTEANHNAWLTGESYEKAIKPMRRLSERFISTLRDHKNASCQRLFNTDTLEYTVTNYAKFGVYINMKGMTDSLFADKLAGCEIDLNINLYRYPDCTVC